MKPLYQVGDVVILKDSCEEDIGTFAWQYIKDHRIAGVICVQPGKNGFMYGLVWPEKFEGGHNCWKKGPASQCQFVTEHHLELENFEASRVVNTVPNIGGDDGEDTKENNL